MFDRQLFFGREALARRALEALGSHSVQLTGERRIGKTSFLHHLQRLLAAANETERRSFPVFVDLEAVTARDLFHALMEEAVLALPGALARSQSCSSAAGRARTRRPISLATCAAWPRSWRSCARQPVRLVLLIDEVDAVRAGPAPSSDAWLGRLVSNVTPELRVVLSGVGPFGALEALQLEPLAPGDAEALVREPVAGVFHYERPAVERILEVSGLRPFAIQRLCLHAVNRMLDEGRTTVRVADVEAVS